MSKKIIRRQWLIKAVGFVIVVISCAFLFYQGQQLWDKIADIEISVSIWVFIIVSSSVYGLLLSILSIGWWQLLQLFALRELPSLCEIFKIFMRTQIAKYLPGNVFHYVGRIGMLRQKGLAIGKVTMSLTYEAALLLLVASVLAGVSAVILGINIDLQFSEYFTWLAGVIVLFILSLAAVSYYWPSFLKQLLTSVRDSWLKLLLIIICYTVFFICYSLLLWVASSIVGETISYWLALAAICLPWAVGFVIPGAPGGVGVREALMLMILAQFIAPADALLLALLMRLVTVCGDACAFLFSYFPCRRREYTLFW